MNAARYFIRREEDEPPPFPHHSALLFKTVRDPSQTHVPPVTFAQRPPHACHPFLTPRHTTDIGAQNDPTPAKKDWVGSRLALSARSVAYGETLVSSGPVFKELAVQGAKVLVRFDSVGAGLEARGGKLTGFAVSGEDKQFVWADAQIQPDNSVLVSSAAVPKPVAVRYGWADFPVVNLFNKDGLPASPFRTDTFSVPPPPAPAKKK